MNPLDQTRNADVYAAQSQTNLQQAQTHELSSRSLKLTWEIHDRDRKRLEDELRELEGREASIKKREDTLAKHAAEVDEKALKADASLTESMKEFQNAEALRAESIRMREELETRRSVLEPFFEKAEQCKKERAENEAVLGEQKKIFQEAQEIKKTNERKYQDILNVEQRIIELQKCIWPESILPSVEWLKKAEVEGEGTGEMALLCAAMHTFCAVEKLNDLRALCEALWIISRHLYELFPAREIETAADAFNKASNGRYEIKTAKMGDPVDGWMNYQPGLTNVNRVTTWAVYMNEGAARGLKLVYQADVK